MDLDLRNCVENLRIPKNNCSDLLKLIKAIMMSNSVDELDQCHVNLQEDETDMPYTIRSITKYSAYQIISATLSMQNACAHACDLNTGLRERDLVQENGNPNTSNRDGATSRPIDNCNLYLIQWVIRQVSICNAWTGRPLTYLPLSTISNNTVN